MRSRRDETAGSERVRRPLAQERQHRQWQLHHLAGRTFPPFASISVSPLLRHLGAMHFRDESLAWLRLSNGTLGLLAQYASNLLSLWCALTLVPNEPLILPVKLMSLHLQLDNKYTDASINGVLMTLAALPSLSRLHLKLRDSDEGALVEFRLLAASRSLTDVTLETINGDCPVLSNAQVEQIRSSLGALHRFSLGELDSDMLARLLQPPVTAQWRDVGQVHGDEHTGELLLGLPTLTKLTLSHYEQIIPHVDFLPQLLQLTSLDLRCGYAGFWFIPTDALLASLVLCVGLTDLSLCCGFRSSHWSALFAKLTKLKKLTISEMALETLQCFASGPITQSLEELMLDHLALPPSEVPVLGLPPSESPICMLLVVSARCAWTSASRRAWLMPRLTRSLPPLPCFHR